MFFLLFSALYSSAAVSVQSHAATLFVDFVMRVASRLSASVVTLPLYKYSQREIATYQRHFKSMCQI